MADRCGSFQQYQCSRDVDHRGSHRAMGDDGTEYSWPRTEIARATTRHMFSVCLLRGEMDRWVVVCDACGVELDVAGGGMPVFRVRGLDELSAEAAEEYARRLQALAAARSVSRAIVVDNNVELEGLGHDLEARLIEHSETCGKLEKK